MIDAAEALTQFIEGRTVVDLDRDRMLLFAVVRPTLLGTLKRVVNES
jgi:hypothetical protein